MRTLFAAIAILFLFAASNRELSGALVAAPSPTPRVVPARNRMPASSPYAVPVIKLDPAWYLLPRDMASFDKAAYTPPHYKPLPRMLPSVRRRWENFFGLLRTLSFLYLFGYLALFLPAFRFGAYALSPYEKYYRYESILVGERTALALWRARRRYERISEAQWHALSSLPLGAMVKFPAGRRGIIATGHIEYRFDFWEPDSMRQFRIYVLAEPIEGETYALLVQPKVLGDWRRVSVRSGIMHPSFRTEESPIVWPPQDKITLLGEQGWPANYELIATNWEKKGINTVATDLYGTMRRASDPPGRQYPPRLGAFWAYRSARGQVHAHAPRQLHIFLLIDEAMMLETDEIPARQVSFDLHPGGQSLAFLRHKP